MQELEAHAEDVEFQRRFLTIKLEKKRRLADRISELCNIRVNPHAIFDVQVKRLHEYNGQHLNLFHILTLYRQIVQDLSYEIYPRVFVFAAKSTLGYKMAKVIIYAINAVAARINSDERLGDKLKVAFLPNYGVTLAEEIIPAAYVSEQISTSEKEASGTGNMKLTLNGALTMEPSMKPMSKFVRRRRPQHFYLRQESRGRKSKKCSETATILSISTIRTTN